MSTLRVLREAPSAPERDRWLTIGALALVTVCVLGLSVYGPRETLLFIFASLGAFALALFVVNPRYEISLLVLLVYLMTFDGYLKLKTGSSYITLIRGILVFAIAAGATVRLIGGRRVSVPPLTGWVLLFVAVCLVQVLNPHNRAYLHAVAGLKPHLEFVPLFFLGYATMRTPGRLRIFLLVLLIGTAINALVANYQYQLTPAEFATWGPGYERLIVGTGAVAGRVALGAAGTGGVVRPFGLGSDVGFSGNLAAIAAPAALALLMLSRRRPTRLAALVLAAGVVLGLVASQARISIIAAAFSLVAFALFIGLSGRRARLLIAASLVVVTGWLVISIASHTVGSTVFQRYHSIAPSTVVSTGVSYKSNSFGALEHYFTEYPFGAGLGRVGPASGFVGTTSQGLNAENEFNFLMLELGYPGLLVICGFLINLCYLALARLRTIADPETRVLLAAIAAALAGTFATFAGGPVLAGPPGSPYMWFAGGILAYWVSTPRATHVPLPARTR